MLRVPTSLARQPAWTLMTGGYDRVVRVWDCSRVGEADRMRRRLEGAPPVRLARTTTAGAAGNVAHRLVVPGMTQQKSATRSAHPVSVSRGAQGQLATAGPGVLSDVLRIVSLCRSR
jgi:hypothetical protein